MMSKEEIEKKLNEMPAYMHDFDANQMFIGIFIKKIENQGKNKSNIYMFESDGEFIGVWGSKIIDDEMVKAKKGDQVGIKYLGRPEGKNYKLFNICIDHASA